MSRAPNPAPVSAPQQADWKRIALSSEFKALAARKNGFILGAFSFFFVYFLALPVLVGYAPKLMSTRVIGTVTLAYLFALSQFGVGGIIAGLYLRISARLDALTRELLAREARAGSED